MEVTKFTKVTKGGADLVNILPDLPLCALPVLVRVGLADPVLPVALGKQQGRGWSL